MSAAIQYVDADVDLKAAVIRDWQSNAGQFMHIEDGYSIVALAEGKPVALISAYTRHLPVPFGELTEEYIDIIEVQEAYRRRGIGRALAEMVIERSIAKGAFQIRAWSEASRFEALMLWQSLGFALSPIPFKSGDREDHGFYVVKKL